MCSPTTVPWTRPWTPKDVSAIYTRELETRIEGLHMLLAAETRRAETAEADRDHWRRQAELTGQLLTEFPLHKGCTLNQDALHWMSCFR
jgi:hypothetical protein